MRILHVCLAAFYIDNYSYQENILPRMHKRMGHEVKILASTETYIEGKQLGYIESKEYINEDGIQVTRIPYVKWIPSTLVHKLRIYTNFYKYIENFKPDIIFLHDVQFLSLKQIIKYAKINSKLKIVADGHTDFSNSANTFLSRWVLHEMIYRPVIKRAEPYIRRFYGVLPARVDFFRNVYKIPEKKISFLPMGVDDDLANQYGNIETARKIREQYGIEEDDFLIVCGGKIDLAKTQTLLLMEAVKRIDNPKIKLIIFGSIVEELKDQFYKLCSSQIQFLGWATVSESYQYFSAADLVVFPGRHSVYWEQAAGLGKPLVVKYWEGTTHVNLGGNAEFLYNDSVDEIMERIKEISTDDEKFKAMKQCAIEKGREFFSYYEIARRSIDI